MATGSVSPAPMVWLWATVEATATQALIEAAAIRKRASLDTVLAARRVEAAALALAKPEGESAQLLVWVWEWPSATVSIWDGCTSLGLTRSKATIKLRAMR